MMRCASEELGFDAAVSSIGIIDGTECISTA